MAALPRRKWLKALLGGNDMPSLSNLRAGANALLLPFWQKFQVWQENYRNDPVRSPTGRYWQGLL